MLHFSNPASFLFYHARRLAAVGLIAINLRILDVLTEAFQPPLVSPVHVWKPWSIWRLLPPKLARKPPKSSLPFRLVLWLLYPSPKATFAHLSSIISVLQWTEKIWSIHYQAAAIMIGGGDNDRRLGTHPKPPIFMFFILACDGSNPRFSYMPSSNFESFLEYNV